MPTGTGGSLTKEFPLSEVDRTIQLVTSDLSCAEFRRIAGQFTHVEIPALVAKRFLLVRDGMVVRDRFISVAEAEGLQTPRVRKIMYMTWALRDERLRRYILEVVADRRGSWRSAEITRKSNASFFEEFFRKTTAPKVRSNIEYFLIEAGIYDPSSGSVHLEMEDGWLSDAVRVAAQHEPGAAARRMMMNDPVGHVVAHGWSGLANATAESLRRVEAVADPEIGGTDDDELGRMWPPEQTFRPWKRRRPSSSSRKSTKAHIDLVTRERANRAHHLLEQIMAERARDCGHLPCFNERIDLFFATPSGTVLAEMKSCSRMNLHSQVRRGVSQLLEYEYVYAELLGESVTRVLALETRPSTGQDWLLQYMQHLGIVLVWKSPGEERLQTEMAIPIPLSGVVLPIKR